MAGAQSRNLTEKATAALVAFRISQVRRPPRMFIIDDETVGMPCFGLQMRVIDGQVVMRVLQRLGIVRGPEPNCDDDTGRHQNRQTDHRGHGAAGRFSASSAASMRRSCGLHGLVWRLGQTALADPLWRCAEIDFRTRLSVSPGVCSSGQVWSRSVACVFWPPSFWSRNARRVPVTAVAKCARHGPQKISNNPQAPCPPPTHMATTPSFASRPRPSSSRCPAMRAPDMP